MGGTRMQTKWNKIVATIVVYNFAPRGTKFITLITNHIINWNNIANSKGTKCTHKEQNTIMDVDGTKL
jgi:hypothetical protein